MADDRDNNRNDWFDEANPFVAFRRYADEQVSTLLQSITGLPSTVTPPHHDRWEIFTEDHGFENRGVLQRTGDTSDRDRQNEARGGNDRNHEDRSKRWFNGPYDFFGFDSFLVPLATHLINSHISLPGMFEDTESPTWPIAYIMLSPYSPLHLERQAKYRAHRENGVFAYIMASLYLDTDRDPSEPQWREAFEDLLRLENGKPMLNRDSTAQPESGKDWLQGLVKRGSLGDQWKFVPRREGRPWSGITFSGHSEHAQDQEQSHDQEDKDSQLLPDQETKNERKIAETELELYERFLSDIESRERESLRTVPESPLLRLLLAEHSKQQEKLEEHKRDGHITNERRDVNEDVIGVVSSENKQSVTETPHDMTETKPESASGASSRVVSTMTRTERVQLPDGSVKSTIVKTKRFADGREEQDSSVELSHSQQGASASEKSQNGWFWKD
ncbi:unnamed protein product [Penicillium olsonii]|nr:unnamed protein product [Penicillium olsonii]CAG8014436.1 unnamed protein product [Penicillium olsonii]